MYIFSLLVFLPYNIAMACSNPFACNNIILVQNTEAISLNPSLINHLQRKFNGRVVGLQENTTRCKQITQAVTIAGKAEFATKWICLQPDGSWKRGRLIDVQILQPHNHIIFVIIDPVSGVIIEVRN